MNTCFHYYKLGLEGVVIFNNTHLLTGKDKN